MVDKALKKRWRVCLAVHDEIVLEVPDEETELAKEVLEQCMINGMKKFIKEVPIVVGVKVEDHWTK